MCRDNYNHLANHLLHSRKVEKENGSGDSHPHLADPWLPAMIDVPPPLLSSQGNDLFFHVSLPLPKLSAQSRSLGISLAKVLQTDWVFEGVLFKGILPSGFFWTMQIPSVLISSGISSASPLVDQPRISMFFKLQAGFSGSLFLAVRLVFLLISWDLSSVIASQSISTCGTTTVQIGKKSWKILKRKKTIPDRWYLARKSVMLMRSESPHLQDPTLSLPFKKQWQPHISVFDRIGQPNGKNTIMNNKSVFDRLDFHHNKASQHGMSNYVAPKSNIFHWLRFDIRSSEKAMNIDQGIHPSNSNITRIKAFILTTVTSETERVAKFKIQMWWNPRWILLSTVTTRDVWGMDNGALIVAGLWSVTNIKSLITIPQLAKAWKIQTKASSDRLLRGKILFKKKIYWCVWVVSAKATTWRDIISSYLSIIHGIFAVPLSGCFSDSFNFAYPQSSMSTPSLPTPPLDSNMA
jgi:hypothetical protein